jgi:RimJ/RimL family protein N-acetyltransferase
MKRYACLQRERFEYGAYAVTGVQESHIESIRLWRNAQMDVLRQREPIEPQRQAEYFDRYIWPTMAQPRPANILFGFFLDQKLIGYGGLVHVDWEYARAEISFLLSPERAHYNHGYAEDFSAFLRLVKHVAFDDLKLHRLFTETYDIRPHHVSILEANGFVREGVLRGHVWINGRAVDSIFHGCLNENKR